MRILIYAPSAEGGCALRGMIASVCREAVCVVSIAEAERLCRVRRFDAFISVGYGWCRAGRALRHSIGRGGILVLSEGGDVRDVVGVLGEAHQYLSLPVDPRRLRAKLHKMRRQ
ncbi:MAG: hypothetical protein IKA60_00115 [Rikenellaceae bacterium]|nr:hypothetical protein [Rikenellaceae bacterium]MBR2332724.1 hypothetical protein [Rikenellaceae bacterium]